MPARANAVSAVVAALVAAALVASLAQAGDDPIDGAGPVFVPNLPGPQPGGGTGGETRQAAAAQAAALGATEVSDTATAAIAGELASARNFCGGIADRNYIVDCLASEIGALADRMAESGDYAPVREQLEQASRSLNGLAQANRAPEKPRARARRGGPTPQTSARPLTPTRAEALDEVLASAATILEEVETTLLRSTQQGDERRVHFERIAEAVGSNKVLLRSL
jgi:hypothetical protein